MSKTPLPFLLAVAAISLPARLASADACAAPADVEVLLAPETSCVTITDEPECNGGSMLTITNGCMTDLIGVERRSTVQNLPEGTPPLDACLAPWQTAKENGQPPPDCVLAPGKTGTVRVRDSDVLEFSLEGKPLLATVKGVPSAEEGGEGGGGCVMSPAGGGGLSAVVLAALTALLGRRRRGKRPARA